MFNLKAQKSPDSKALLENELSALCILIEPDGYCLHLGDQDIKVNDLRETLPVIEEATKELKQSLLEKWHELAKLARSLVYTTGNNSGGLNNLIFVNSVKKSFLLSRVFLDLDPISRAIKDLFYVDPTSVSTDQMSKYNKIYLEIRLLHYLVMREMYRTRLIYKYLKVTKTAQISGPWSNLDLPMKERVWEWDEAEEEYFAQRTKARREQVRYNPEEDRQGFYFVWQDLSTDPYKFEDMKSDSPYKSRHLLTIASRK